MSASAPWRELSKALDKCAPGWSWRLATHSRVISYNGKVYRAFPKADDIEFGHIRSLGRDFGILDCLKKHIQGL
jgi:hypothetical protein